MIIIFLGPPGAGKGTQAEMLGQKLKLPAISLGHLLREAYERGAPEGKLWWEKYGSHGLNAPIDLKFNILLNRLNEEKSGLILDNFPRTKEDLIALEKYLEEKKEKIDRVFHLTVSDEVVARRILQGRKGKERSLGLVRGDDRSEILAVRIEEGYRKDLAVILDYFRKLNVLEEINGETTREEVHREILDRLGIND